MNDVDIVFSITIYRLADLFERDINILANLETLDNGKPFVSAVGDVKASISTLKYYAGWCDKIHGNTIPVGKQTEIKKKKTIATSLIYFG